MKKLCIFLATVIFILAAVIPLEANAETSAAPELKSNIALLINLDTDTVVFEKNAGRTTDPSSLTKVVTAILALENCKDLDKPVTAQEQAIDALKNVLGANAQIKTGEELTMRQLLLCMMAQSANEASNVIAQELGGSLDGFTAMMNEFVEKIGCTTTNFVNAHGIYQEGQFTNANDMALIAKYAINVPGFMDIAGINDSHSLIIPATNLSKERQLAQTNKMLIKTSPYYYKYANGIKTGSSGPDECCIMATATKDGYNYLCIIMEAPYEKSQDGKSKTNYAMTEAKALFQWAFNNLKYKTIVNSATTVYELPVEYAWNIDHIQLVPENDISELVPADLDASGVLIVPDPESLPEKIEAPASKGDVVGVASIMIANKEVAKVNLVLPENIKRSNTLYILQQLKNVFTSTIFKVLIVLVILLIVGYIALNIAYNRKKKSCALQAKKQVRAARRLSADMTVCVCVHSMTIRVLPQGMMTRVFVPAMTVIPAAVPVRTEAHEAGTTITTITNNCLYIPSFGLGGGICFFNNA